MDVGFFGDAARPPPFCQPCREASDAKHYMNRTQVWSPEYAAWVDAWECPNCGRTVMRSEGGDVGLTNPDGERW